VGALGVADPVKSVGFDYSAAGHSAFEDIKSYYRNIAVWIASPTAQSQMWWRALWWTRWHHRRVMDLRPPYLKGGVVLGLAELIRIGSGGARRPWPRGRRFSRTWAELAPVVDPWRPRPPLPDPPPDAPAELDVATPDLVDALYAEVLVDAVMGAAAYDGWAGSSSNPHGLF
jgi:hypothetical protein